jgi:hypothetical protein
MSVDDATWIAHEESIQFDGEYNSCQSMRSVAQDGIASRRRRTPSDGDHADGDHELLWISSLITPQLYGTFPKLGR